MRNIYSLIIQRNMSFTSYSFLFLFLPVTWGLCWLTHRSVKCQNAILLGASVLFYASYDIKYVIYLFICVLITYVGGLLLDANLHMKRDVKLILCVAICLNLSLLLFCKYSVFAVKNINFFIQPLNVTIELPQILLPVGLSFYVFQSSTYLFDLYRGKLEQPERNLIRYGLFVSFFPTIISGPIQRSEKFLPQIKNRKMPSFEIAQEGLFIFLWGVFSKVVIADRLGLFVNEVYANISEYSGIVMVACAVAYSLQIYADFSGYSYMAIGIARLFGFELPNNFRQPYFATSVVDFWRRWHISLTSWFTDYLYIPLGGNRKGDIRRYVNVFVVFLVSGLWHGANWTFVIWGGLHAMFQIASYLTKKMRLNLCASIGIDKNTTTHKVFQRLVDFGLISFAWIFFRAPSLGDAIEYIRRSFEFNPWILLDGSLFSIGLNPIDWVLLIFLIALFFVVSVYRERGITCKKLIAQPVVVRILFFWLLLYSILIFGIYGGEFSANAFIYAGF